MNWQHKGERACSVYRPWRGPLQPEYVVDPCGNCGRSQFAHRVSTGWLPSMEEIEIDVPGAGPLTPKGPGDSIPSHYQGEGMQPFDVIRAFGLDYWEGNVVKYVLRWRKKNGVEDLKKAAHYLACMIEFEEGKDV